MGNVVEQDLPEFNKWIAEVPSEEKTTNYVTNGELQNTIWYSPEDNGSVIHRDPSEGPAYRYYDRDTGKLKVERYIVKGELHRLDGPALRRFDEKGVFAESYYVCGHMHRVDGPASINYNDNDNVDREMWVYCGKRHRTIEPALIDYDDQGNVTDSLYYHHGTEIIVPKGYEEYDEELKSFTWEMLINGV